VPNLPLLAIGLDKELKLYSAKSMVAICQFPANSLTLCEDIYRTINVVAFFLESCLWLIFYPMVLYQIVDFYR
jgi:hypothetical protein